MELEINGARNVVHPLNVPQRRIQRCKDVPVVGHLATHHHRIHFPTNRPRVVKTDIVADVERMSRTGVRACVRASVRALYVRTYVQLYVHRYVRMNEQRTRRSSKSIQFATST